MSSTQAVLSREEVAATSTCAICQGPLRLRFPFGTSPTVVRCRVCGTESLSPLPTRLQLKAHYANYEVTNTSEEQVVFLTSLYKQSLKFYLDRIGSKNPDGLRLLEVGFGNGAALFAASQMGMRAYGVDLDEANVGRARKYAQRRSLPVTLDCGDEQSIDKFGVSFDIVRASQVLEHVIDPQKFLAAVSAVQHSGAHLIIECPNNDSAFWLVKNASRKKFGRINFYNSLKLMEHLWGYNKKSLRLLLERAGYRVLFLRDYASGNAIFEPQSVLWYPTVGHGLKLAMKNRSLHHLMYPSARVLDRVCSLVLNSGTSLAALCERI